MHYTDDYFVVGYKYKISSNKHNGAIYVLRSKNSKIYKGFPLYFECISHAHSWYMSLTHLKAGTYDEVVIKLPNTKKEIEELLTWK